MALLHLSSKTIRFWRHAPIQKGFSNKLVILYELFLLRFVSYDLFLQNILTLRLRLKSTDSQGGGGGENAATFNEDAAEEEHKMIGVVNARVYWTYLSYTGRGVAIFIILTMCIMYTFHSGQDVWMTVWLGHISHNCSNESSSNDHSLRHFFVYTHHLNAIPASQNDYESCSLVEKSSDDLTFYLG